MDQGQMGDNIVAQPKVLLQSYYQKNQILEVDINNYILWKDDLLKFEDIDLIRVLRTLERHYNISFQLNESSVGKIKMNGKLDLGKSKDEVLTFISIVAGIEIIKMKGNKYVIK